MSHAVDGAIAMICGRLHERLSETQVKSERMTEKPEVTVIRIDQDDQFLEYSVTDTTIRQSRSLEPIINDIIAEWSRPWANGDVCGDERSGR